MTRPLSKSCTASTASTVSTSLLLHLLLLTTNTTTITYTSAASWETSNDPDSLCLRNSSPQTGYRATLDCRGYVYCNDGYLMGGVIPCWPNQLFDERTDTCASWQGVLEGTVGDGGDMNMRCPLFDGEMMLPDVVDGNANPERFFVSWKYFILLYYIVLYCIILIWFDCWIIVSNKRNQLFYCLQRKGKRQQNIVDF